MTNDRRRTVWVSRHRHFLTYAAVYIVALAPIEYLVIVKFLRPIAASQPFDWLVGTGLAAPVAALAIVFVFLLIGWLITLILPVGDREDEED